MSSSVRFEVHNEFSGRVHRLIPTGELDIATAPVLERAFNAVYHDDDATVIVVDLTQLSFMDSTGIALLLRMTAACSDDRLRIVNGTPSVVRVLELAGVRDRLPIISSDDDPLASLP